MSRGDVQKPTPGSQDNKEAVKWYRLAAEQGLAWAQVNLGTMYFLGNGVQKDYKEAVKWFQHCYQQNDLAKQGKLANLGFPYQIHHFEVTEALKTYVEKRKKNVMNKHQKN